MASLYKTTGTVKSNWIDFNGHMNVGYYGVALDEAGDQFFDALEIGADYRAATNGSFFTVESHLTYQAELMEGEEFVVYHRLIDVGPKAVHFFGEMQKLDGTKAATAEWLHLHMDMNTRKVAPLPDELFERLSAIAAEHSALDAPPELGRVMAIKKPK